MIPTTQTLIPRKILFSDPQQFLVKLSPDGKYLSYFAPFEGNLNLWIAPSTRPREAKLISKSKQPLKDYCWAFGGDHLLYISDQFGDENWQLHGYQLSTGKTSTYTPKGCQVRILQLSAKHPEKILLGLNERDRRFHDVFELDIIKNSLTCVYENHQGYWDFFADEDLTLQVALNVVENGGEYIALNQKNKIATVTLHDLFGLYFYPRLRLGLAKNHILYFIHSRESNTSILGGTNTTNQQEFNIGGDPKADICDVLLEPHTKVPLAFAVNNDRKRWYGLTPEIQQHIEFLQALDHGDIDILSQSADNQQWIVSYIHDNGPVTYYLYQVSSQHAQFLFDSHQEFKNYTFTTMMPHEIIARDGLKLMTYLSLPPQAKIHPQPVPMVLMVHGGPNYRDFWGFNPVHQWLADRGYAVLSVNYRASTGYGKAHFKAGHGEWAGKIHEDLLDAIEWAIQKGITTRDKIAIMGRSFGGYATLVGLTMTPEVFCCGIDMVGPANLVTMAKHFPPYWKAFKGAINEMIGCNPDTPEGQAYLLARSPLKYADKITKPLLIGHGANDVRVMQSESDAMVNAMQENNIPVTYVIFPDEGHQMLHPENRMAFYALAEAFLAKNLGRPFEPYDKKITTSMVVKSDDFKLMEQ